MSIRSNSTGILQCPVTGGPGNTLPLTMCAWVKLVSRAGGFGVVLAYQDSLFNVAPGFIFTNLDDQIYFTPGPGINIPIVADPTRWCFIALIWNGVDTCVAMALDANGLWTEQEHNSAGASVPPTIFIGGQTIGGGGVTPDADLLYRGVHVWGEFKDRQFVRQQASQLAPISEDNLWSTTYFYDLSTAQLGQSMVGRSWQPSIATTWTVSNAQLNDPGVGATPISITFTGAIAAGDALVAYFGTTLSNNPPGGVGTLLDSSGNTWVIADRRDTSDGLCTVWIAYAENVAAAAPGANVLTWTPVGMDSAIVFLAACEVNSSFGRPTFDVVAGATGNDAAPTVSATSSVTNSLQIGCCAENAVPGPPTVGTSPFTAIETAGVADALLASFTDNSVDVTTAGFQTGAGGLPAPWAAQILCFRVLAPSWTTSFDEPPRASTRSEAWEVGN